MRSFGVALFAWALIFASAAFAQSQSQAQRAAGQAAEVTQQRFGDWSYRCAQPGEKASAATTCELAQSVQIQRDGQMLEVVSLAVSRVKDKASQVDWALVAVTPLDVHLPSKFGIGIGVGEKAVATAEYRNCNRFGCWAVVPLSAALLKQFRAGNEAALLFRMLDGKTVRIVFSLKGFTKGLRALQTGKMPDNT